MKKLKTRFSVPVVLAALLCFAPGAFGQAQGTVRGGNIMSSPTSFVVLAFQPPNHQNGNNGSGCGNQNWGWDQGGKGNCSQVPEGGSALGYVSLAGLCCLGAALLRFRRKARLSPTN